MMRIGLALSVVALLAACITEDDGSRMSPEERASCEAAGGEIGIAGLSGDEFCVLPTPDAGKACTTSRDCETVCEAQTMTCGATDNPFGCHDYIDDHGQRVNICVD